MTPHLTLSLPDGRVGANALNRHHHHHQHHYVTSLPPQGVPAPSGSPRTDGLPVSSPSWPLPLAQLCLRTRSGGGAVPPNAANRRSRLSARLSSVLRPHLPGWKRGLEHNCPGTLTSESGNTPGALRPNPALAGQLPHHRRPQSKPRFRPTNSTQHLRPTPPPQPAPPFGSHSRPFSLPWRTGLPHRQTPRSAPASSNSSARRRPAGIPPRHLPPRPLTANQPKPPKLPHRRQAKQPTNQPTNQPANQASPTTAAPPQAQSGSYLAKARQANPGTTPHTQHQRFQALRPGLDDQGPHLLPTPHRRPNRSSCGRLPQRP